MARRKLKPGRKRSVGRPASAQRRERDANRLQSEREILAKMGLVYVTVVVDENYATSLKEDGKVLRLKGLLDHAMQSDDAEKSRLLAARLEIAEISRNRTLAERAAQKAENDRLSAIQADRLEKANKAASRLSDARLQPSAARPVEQASRISESELQDALRRSQPFATFSPNR